MLTLITNNGTMYCVIEGCPEPTNSGIATVERNCRDCDHLYEIHTNHIKEPNVITIKCNYIVTDD